MATTNPPPAETRESAPPLSSPHGELPVHILVVDREPSQGHITTVLMQHGHRVGVALGLQEARTYMHLRSPDVALVDADFAVGAESYSFVPELRREAPDAQILLMTRSGGEEGRLLASSAGADDFIARPFEDHDLLHRVHKAWQQGKLLKKAKHLEARLHQRDRFGDFIGTSPKMQAVYKLIEGVATARSTILILGESGTGKELVARAIHERSQRAERPFVAVNCAAIPKDLVESELFGHVRGAFTGAQTSRTGLFETAHSGTLFLDEVGDLPLAAQVKLLRALQHGEVKPVGSDTSRTVDVRVVAATNVDLALKIADGSFRKDLFYRLNVIAVALPPLRERGEDSVLLARHFLQKFARAMDKRVETLSDAAVDAIRAYSWPGNVRELEHALERAVVLAKRTQLEVEDLPIPVSSPALPDVGEGTPMSSPDSWLPQPQALANMPHADAKRIVMDLFNDAYTGELLRQTGGNVSEAARRAGVDRANFRRLMRRTGKK